MIYQSEIVDVIGQAYGVWPSLPMISRLFKEHRVNKKVVCCVFFGYKFLSSMLTSHRCYAGLCMFVMKKAED